MVPPREVVITGLGVVSPIGLGRDAFWRSLAAGSSGIALLSEFAGGIAPSPIGGQVHDFDPKLYVTPRKSLKVMSREIQFGFAAARLALEEAGLSAGAVDPDRFGVVFGADMIYCDPAELAPAFRSCISGGAFDASLWGSRALGEMFPLWMLKFLPNMPACHIAIANDARGPNNSVLMGQASSLLAMAESVRLIERSLADVVIAGGSGCRIHPMMWVCREERLMSQRYHEPQRALRPFDAQRDGTVFGEGAAAFVLESRGHAQRGGGPCWPRWSITPARSKPRDNSPRPSAAASAPRSDRSWLGPASRPPTSTTSTSTDWAQSLPIVPKPRPSAELGDVPVTAPKSFFGNLGAATGAVEMAVSLLAFAHGQIPVTLNYDQPDPECPVRVIHGEPAPSTKPFALLLNQSTTGQAVAVLIARPDEN